MVRYLITVTGSQSPIHHFSYVLVEGSRERLTFGLYELRCSTLLKHGIWILMGIVVVEGGCYHLRRLTQAPFRTYQFGQRSGYRDQDFTPGLWPQLLWFLQLFQPNPDNTRIDLRVVANWMIGSSLLVQLVGFSIWPQPQRDTIKLSKLEVSRNLTVPSMIFFYVKRN